MIDRTSLMWNISQLGRTFLNNNTIFCVTFSICWKEKEYKYFNPQHAGTELTRLNLVYIMFADALAPYVARASAAMILTV